MKSNKFFIFSLFLIFITFTFADVELKFQPRVTKEKIEEQTGLKLGNSKESEKENTKKVNDGIKSSESKENNKQAEKTVYITPKGKKYHKAGCRYAKNATAIDKSIAEKRGYTACKVCKP